MMNYKIKNLFVRTVSGIIYVALLITGVFFPPVMLALLCLCSILAIREFCQLTSGPKDRLSEFMMIAVAITNFFVMYVQSVKMSAWTSPMGPFVTFLLVFPLMVIAYVVIMAVAELFRKRPCPIEQIGKGIFGLLWIVLPLGLMSGMTYAFPQLVFAFLLLAWCNDTFAYLGGSLYGKHKLFERISPKKTWEGTLTGIILTIVLALLLSNLSLFQEGSCMFGAVQWTLFAILTVLFGIFGDLLESLFKRNADVKDSGKIIPGHGGILDRFDSILFAATPVFLYVFCLFVSGF